MGRILGVVGLWQDDVDAPEGRSALRPLGGATLLDRAVDGLAEHPAISAVTVLRGDAGAPPTAELAALAAALPAEHPDVERLALHDPRFALVQAAFVLDLLVAALDAAPDAVAAVPVRAVTDTIKRVDDDGDVLATLDRNRYRLVLAPVLVRRDTVAKAAGAVRSAPAGSGWEPLVATLAGLGRVLTVDSPYELFPLRDEASLQVARVVTGDAAAGGSAAERAAQPDA